MAPVGAAASDHSAQEVLARQSPHPFDVIFFTKFLLHMCEMRSYSLIDGLSERPCKSTDLQGQPANHVRHRHK